jgi:hypothetical protein
MVVPHLDNHHKVEVVDVVAVVVLNHLDNQQSSLEATAPNYHAASSTAVTTSKLTHS